MHDKEDMPFLAAIISIGAYSIFKVVRTTYYIQIGENIAEQTIPFSRKNPRAALRILIAGDSTAHGVGASSPETSLAGLVGAYYPNAEIINISANGAKVKDAQRQLERITEAYDILFLHIGGNDVIRRTPYQHFKKHFAQLVSCAQHKARHILVTSTGNMGTALLLPLGTRRYFENRTKNIRMIMQEIIAKQNTATIRYTDLFTKRTNDPFAQNPKKYYSADYFHPSDAGYACWFEKMKQELYHFPYASTPHS